MILRIGDQGADVGRVQQMIVEGGYEVTADELKTASFGKSTYDAIRQFQVGHVDSHGHALYEDGVIGPETLWALMSPGSSTSNNRYTAPGWRCAPTSARPGLVNVLTAAVGQIGNCEDPDGSNMGPTIDKYGQDGQPWCAYFVSWCYLYSEPPHPFGVIASALKMQEWAQAQKRVLGAGAQLLPGDVGVILRANFHGHVVLVGGVLDDGKIATVEGNSGNAVRGLVRAREAFACFVRPIPL